MLPFRVSSVMKAEHPLTHCRILSYNVGMETTFATDSIIRRHIEAIEKPFSKAKLIDALTEASLEIESSCSFSRGTGTAQLIDTATVSGYEGQHRQAIAYGEWSALETIIDTFLDSKA